MNTLATLYLKYRGTSLMRTAYMAFTVAMLGLALCGVRRPTPDCNSSCGLV